MRGVQIKASYLKELLGTDQFGDSITLFYCPPIHPKNAGSARLPILTNRDKSIYSSIYTNSYYIFRRYPGLSKQPRDNLFHRLQPVVCILFCPGWSRIDDRIFLSPCSYNLALFAPKDCLQGLGTDVAAYYITHNRLLALKKTKGFIKSLEKVARVLAASKTVR